MGNCSTAKPKPKGPTGPRRKYSVYFPSTYNGEQKYAERECRQGGINFKDIQDIFNDKYKLPDPAEVAAAAAAAETHNEAEQSTHIQKGSTRAITKPPTIAITTTAPLKRGDSDEIYASNKDAFNNFDFNDPVDHPDGI